MEYYFRSLLQPTQFIQYFKTLQIFLTARISLTSYSLSSVIQIGGRGSLYYPSNKLFAAFYSQSREKTKWIFIKFSSLILKECLTFFKSYIDRLFGGLAYGLASRFFGFLLTSIPYLLLKSLPRDNINLYRTPFSLTPFL